MPVLRVLLALATAGAVAAAVLVVGGPSSGAQVSERTVTVSKGVIQAVVSGSGNVEPSKQQDVDFATSGQVTKIYVHEGERLAKGDLIARVDSSAQRVAVAKAQADLVDAEDALTDAQDAEVAATPTPTRGAGPQATATAVPTAAPQPQQGSGQSVDSAHANVQSAQLALAQAQDDLDATELRAPIAGTVAELNGAVGDTVGAASAASSSSSDSGSAFVVLANLHRLRLPVSLSESDIGKVRKGQSATVTINAASGEKVAARVTKVGILSSSSTAGATGAVSYPVTLTLDQSTRGIKAGMSATADIVVAQASGLMVPTQALRGSTVTVQRNGRRGTQRVETGVVGDSVTQVVSGLQAGDKVVVSSSTAALGQAARRTGQGGASTGPGGFGGPVGGGGFIPRFQQRGG
jgi:macrolide-specific efflux system membrane fusion protein